MSEERSDLPQARELIDILNRFLERLGDGQVRILNDLEVRLEQATQRGTSAGMSEAASTVAELPSYVREGSLRQSIVHPIRMQSASTLTEMAKASTADTRAAIIEVREEARRVLGRVVPKIAVPWLLVGILAMLTLTTIAFVLGVKVASGTTFDQGFVAGARDRMLRERAFYEGLDRSDQADLERHDAHLDRSMRLNFSGRFGRWHMSHTSPMPYFEAIPNVGLASGGPVPSATPTLVAAVQQIGPTGQVATEDFSKMAVMQIDVVARTANPQFPNGLHTYIDITRSDEGRIHHQYIAADPVGGTPFTGEGGQLTYIEGHEKASNALIHSAPLHAPPGMTLTQYGNAIVDGAKAYNEHPVRYDGSRRMATTAIHSCRRSWSSKAARRHRAISRR